MSVVQPSAAAKQRGPRKVERKGFRLSPNLDLGLVMGTGLLCLGIGMFCLGIFHGFEHGSCSTTGYSGNYGPVQRCSNGIGWWMLMLFAGLVVAGVGAVLAHCIGSLMLPLVFIAIGAPFIALALGNHGHLLFNASSGSGKIFAGVFGGCFVIAGLTWGVFAARDITDVSAGSLLGGLLAAALGLGTAFAIAGGVSSAIGKTTTPASVQVAPGVTVFSASAERAREISLCKDLVAAQRLVSAHDKALLTAECNTHWKAAEHQLPVVARRAALAYVAAQCKQQTQQAASEAGLPGSAGTTLAHGLAGACANPTADSHGTGLKSLEAQLCQQIVNAQVPAVARRQALATCPK